MQKVNLHSEESILNRRAKLLQDQKESAQWAAATCCKMHAQKPQGSVRTYPNSDVLGPDFVEAGAEVLSAVTAEYGQPDYGSIAGVVGTIDKGIGADVMAGTSMFQASFGSDSSVWAVDHAGHRVNHSDKNGVLIKTIGTGTEGNGPGELSHVVGVAVSDRSVFTSEFHNARISEFNQGDGAFVRVLDTPGLEYPRAICLSPDKTTLAVACPNSNSIKLITVDGSVAPRTIGDERGYAAMTRAAKLELDDGQAKFDFAQREADAAKELGLHDAQVRVNAAQKEADAASMLGLERAQAKFDSQISRCMCGAADKEVPQTEEARAGAVEDKQAAIDAALAQDNAELKAIEDKQDATSADLAEAKADLEAIEDKQAATGADLARAGADLEAIKEKQGALCNVHFECPGHQQAHFDSPCDVHFTPDGQQLVVADHDNSRVQCLDLDGSFLSGTGQISLGAWARAVAVDAAGNIIVTTNNHVKVFSPEGTLLHDVLGGLVLRDAAHSGLTIDPSSGRIAVMDKEVGKPVMLL